MTSQSLALLKKQNRKDTKNDSNITMNSSFLHNFIINMVNLHFNHARQRAVKQTNNITTAL